MPSPRKRPDREIGELRREIADLRRANEPGRPTRPPSARPRRSGAQRSAPRMGGAGKARTRYARRRLALALALGVVLVALATVLPGIIAGPDTFKPPSRASLAGLTLRQRIVAIANSQVGYSTDPSHSYCNKFSSFWDAGTTTCPHGELSEKWCADFAAWAWRRAGVRFIYGYDRAEINGGAISFYEWGVANGTWHPATSGYLATPGDVAVYGLSLGADPSVAHVAIVSGDAPGQRGPDVVNGDGDRSGFSVVETGTNQRQADTGHADNAPLAGFVSPTPA